MPMSTKFSDLHAYLQGVQTRLQIVIATNALLITALAQILGLLKDWVSRTPLLLFGLLFLSVAALVRSIYISATLTGLHPKLRKGLVRRLKDREPAESADLVVEDLHHEMIREFGRKHQAIRYSRLYLYLGIRGIVLYGAIILLFALLDHVHVQLAVSGHNLSAPFLGMLGILGSLWLVLRWGLELSSAQGDLEDEASLIPSPPARDPLDHPDFGYTWLSQKEFAAAVWIASKYDALRERWPVRAPEA